MLLKNTYLPSLWCKNQFIYKCLWDCPGHFLELSVFQSSNLLLLLGVSKPVPQFITFPTCSSSLFCRTLQGFHSKKWTPELEQEIYLCVLPLRHKMEFRQTVYAKTFQELEDSGSLLYFTGCSKRHCGEEKEAGENVMTFCLQRLVWFFSLWCDGSLNSQGVFMG